MHEVQSLLRSRTLSHTPTRNTVVFAQFLDLLNGNKKENDVEVVRSLKELESIKAWN